jgi:hypothetical protein
MSFPLRWRITVLQIITIVVFAFGAGAAFWGSNFTHQQVHDQLAPQEISFPANAQAGLPSNLSQYAGQQVLDGYQAHAYAQDFIGLHLKEMGNDKPYSYWSGVARTEQTQATTAATQVATDQKNLKAATDQATIDSLTAQLAKDQATASQLQAKATQDQGLTDTIFKGETLKSMLNQAWTFWVIGDVAKFAGIGLAIAAILVLASLVFELLVARNDPTKATTA